MNEQTIANLSNWESEYISYMMNYNDLITFTEMRNRIGAMIGLLSKGLRIININTQASSLDRISNSLQTSITDSTQVKDLIFEGFDLLYFVISGEIKEYHKYNSLLQDLKYANYGFEIRKIVYDLIDMTHSIITKYNA